MPEAQDQDTSSYAAAGRLELMEVMETTVQLPADLSVAPAPAEALPSGRGAAQQQLPPPPQQPPPQPPQQQPPPVYEAPYSGGQPPLPQGKSTAERIGPRDSAAGLPLARLPGGAAPAPPPNGAPPLRVAPPPNGAPPLRVAPPTTPKKGPFSTCSEPPLLGKDAYRQMLTRSLTSIHMAQSPTQRLTSKRSGFPAHSDREGAGGGGDDARLLSPDTERSDGAKQGSWWSRMCTKRASVEEEKLWPDAFYTPEVWEFLKEITPSLVRAWEHKLVNKAKKLEVDLASGMPQQEAEAKHKMGIRALDLYVWAVLLGNTDLAIVILPMGDEPIRSALIGARICKHMAELLPVEEPQLKEAASRHEEWAIEILNLCANQDAATTLLTSPTRHWDRNVIGLATFSNMKHFVAHRYCQNMCDAA